MRGITIAAAGFGSKNNRPVASPDLRDMGKSGTLNGPHRKARPMSAEARIPFNNKIFFCDVIGFSRLDPAGQAECQMVLSNSINSALGSLDARLEEDVIALPTGDGMILNFLAAAPDVHLRAALLTLEALAGSDANQAFKLRIGLNTDVDSWVRDINGKKNVVGRGINMAQRVMDLAEHAQVLMHEKVKQDLQNYDTHQGKLVSVGSFVVKHGVELPIAQYVDAQMPYLSAELAKPRMPASKSAMGLSDIVRAQRIENLLQIRLGKPAEDSIPIVEDYVRDFLEQTGELQSLKVAASWIVGEMLTNVFVHTRLQERDELELRVDRMPHSLAISVEQPDCPSFDLKETLARSHDQMSFMGMMDGAGLRWSAQRHNGRLALRLDVPLDFRLEAGPVVTLSDDVRAGRALMVPLVGRIDLNNADRFKELMLRQLHSAAAQEKSLMIDLSGAHYVSSAGLRSLMIVLKDARSKNIEMALLDPKPIVAEQLAISKFDQVFKIIRSK
jgi:anti-anti-sigma factor